MGSKYKDALKAGLAALMIPVGKMLIDVILEKLSNKKYINSSFWEKDREYDSSRYTDGLNNRNS